MKRVLVTGATGFIGRHTLRPLQELGYEIHATYTHAPLKEHPEVHWYKADLLEPTCAEQICSQIQASHLLHLAWYVNPHDYRTSPENILWKEATLRLLKSFQRYGGTRVVLTGTAMEYDQDVLIDTLDESDSPVTPKVNYSQMKQETRIAAEEFAKSSGITFTWARIFNLYGPFEGRGRYVSNLINSLLDDERPSIAAGDLIFDYSYVRDTAGALVALLESEVTGIVNIASGKPVTLFDIADVAAKLLDKSELIRRDPPPPGNKPMRSVASIERLSQEVGWAPHYDLPQGLRETIEWWQQLRSANTSEESA